MALWSLVLFLVLWLCGQPGWRCGAVCCPFGAVALYCPFGAVALGLARLALWRCGAVEMHYSATALNSAWQGLYSPGKRNRDGD